MGPKKNIKKCRKVVKDLSKTSIIKPVKLQRKTPVKLERKTPVKLERKTPVKLERKTKCNSKITPKLKDVITPVAKTKSNGKITPKLKDLLLTPVAKTKSNKVTPTLKKQSNNDCIPTKPKLEFQYSLSDFNGDDSIFEDGCYKKTLIYCCFCHDVVLSIPLFW